MAFWKVRVSLQNPLYIPKSDHIGDHIKARRRKLDLLQEQVAAMIGVTTDTITNWENERSLPKIMHMPALIAFLGYDPVLIEGETLGDRIKRYRVAHGLSHKAMGRLLGVNASTIGSWEKNEFIPTPKFLILLQQLIEGLL